MKRKRSTTEKLISKRNLEGRGQGRGEDYKPGLFIQDVPSQGLATRVQGWKTNRVHHFLSKLELLYFYLLEWALNVLDVREQFPLDLKETLAIAEHLGLRHPTDSHTRHPIVMTTDFLVTIRKPIGLEEKARTIKYSQDLSSKRIMEKFEIERLYWRARDIDWGIVTEREINRVIAANVEWVHPYKHTIDLTPLTANLISRIEALMSPRVVQENVFLRNITDDCDDQLGLPSGSSLMVVRHLIANRRWQIDMSQPIQMSKRMVMIAMPKAIVPKVG
ncbi:MAG TPA: TnsA endonuclease N-terminal domain-containing protein [Pyrinomonadaceae bacterium]|jgi:hypothetical protein|nr:TnsA endonuclease N-terminal domain-containing protein [Pyrinomonadaceae bacterium]